VPIVPEGMLVQFMLASLSLWCAPAFSIGQGGKAGSGAVGGGAGAGIGSVMMRRPKRRALCRSYHCQFFVGVCGRPKDLPRYTGRCCSSSQWVHARAATTPHPAKQTGPLGCHAHTHAHTAKAAVQSHSLTTNAAAPCSGRIGDLHLEMKRVTR